MGSSLDVRQARRARSGGGNTSGVINFGREYTRQASDETQLTASNIGPSLAAFMLGVPTSVAIDDNSPARSLRQREDAHGVVR